MSEENKPTVPEHKILPGVAPKGLYGFEDESGNRMEGGDCIFPILERTNDRKYNFIGTGFYIGNRGLFVTAKHVLNSNQVNGDTLYAWQFVPPKKWGLRPVTQVRLHPTADLAIGLVAGMVDSETGETFYNPRLPLTTKSPSLRERVATFAYPNTVIELTADGYTFSFIPEFYEGQIREFYPKGRDGVMLPTLCYRTDMIIHHGASGGPVAGDSGRVFGVNSTGIDGTEDFFVSGIEEILTLEVTVDESSQEKKTIRQLAEEGHIIIDT